MKDMNRDEVLDYIVKGILEDLPDNDPVECKTIVARIMDLDFEYMRDAGVIVDDTFSDASYYDDDAAFEYVANRLFGELEGEDEQLLMDMMEYYFELFEKYMTEKGLLSWE